MSYPTINIDQKKVILLSGFERKGGEWIARHQGLEPAWAGRQEARRCRCIRLRCGQVDAGRVKRGRPTIPSGRPTA